MKLLYIKLRHFRSHRATTLALQRITFVRGLNRTGKSSIAMAVAMVLAGRCDVTDEAGKGFEQLIEEGAQSALIELEFDEATISLKLDRSTGRTFKVQIGEQKHTIIGKQAQEWIAEHIAPPDVVSICLDASRFLAMSATEQAALLAQVLLPRTLSIAPEVTDWLSASGLSLIEKSTLFATIEATHKSIASARTDVNRTLRDLQNIEEPDAPATSRQAVKANLAALEEQQDAVKDKITALLNERDAIDRANERMAECDRHIAEYEQKLAQVPALLTLDELGKLTETVNRAEAHARMETTLNNAKAEAALVATAIAHLNDETKSGECPTCHSKITDDLRKLIFEPLLDRQTKADALIHRIEKQLADEGSPRDAARAIQRDRNNAEAKHRIDDIIEHHRQQRAEALKSAQQEPPTAAPGETLEDLQRTAAELKQRVVSGLDLLVKTVEQEDRVSEYKKQLTKRATLQQRLAQIEKLLEYFGPGGMVVKLIQERLDLFTAKVNAVLAWWSYTMSFSIEPFLIQINEDGSLAVLRPRQLSTSEQYRLGIAFATAIAEWTGFNMLIADAAETLDKVDKWQLAKALLNSDLTQAIVFSTGIAGTFVSPGTAFYTLSKSKEGGSVTEITLDDETAEEPVVATPEASPAEAVAWQ